MLSFVPSFLSLYCVCTWATNIVRRRGKLCGRHLANSATVLDVEAMKVILCTLLTIVDEFLRMLRVSSFYKTGL